MIKLELMLDEVVTIGGVPLTLRKPILDNKRRCQALTKDGTQCNKPAPRLYLVCDEHRGQVSQK